MKSTFMNLKFSFLLIVSCVLIIGNVSFAQTAKSAELAKHKHNIKEVGIAVMDSSIIRKGTIDLKEIDKNKDGKVFQDQMDWNVISDKSGKCPLCNMFLVEVSLEDARKNLIANGYKTKAIRKTISLKKK